MRIEVVLAIVFAMFAVATIMNPRWIEQLFRFDPDYGSGGAEWLITAAFGVASLVASLFAGRDWRLLAAASGHGDSGSATAVHRGSPVA
jgi:hypothetical protein